MNIRGGLLRIPLIFFVALLMGFLAGCCCHNTFPDPPKKHLPILKSIPSQGEIILEVRGAGRVEIGLFNLTDKSEHVWDLPATVLTQVGPAYFPYQQRSSWAPKTGQLLLGLFGAHYLINKDGNYSELHLKNPVNSKYKNEMNNFALTTDGLLVAYSIKGDLMYQRTDGSEPIRIAYGKLPAWSPDKSKIAFKTNKGKNLTISDINGRVITSIQPGGQILPNYKNRLFRLFSTTKHV